MAATVKKAAPNGKAPSGSAAGKAVAELSDEPRIGAFRGVPLTLPAKLPATFALDMAEVQASEGGEDLGPTYRLIVGILGHAQWVAVRNVIGEAGDSMDQIGDIFAELLGAITEPYGVTPGESEASAIS